mmetsp:Transcript_16479/g.20099  ORF Transcript_16479/g.20099 Transcript_16479/m.20099 type:complete len:221 (-) Transcript_16479:168-830(-)
MPTMRSISFPDSSPQLEILGGNHHNHDNNSKNSMSTPTETESDTIASLRRISIQTPQALLSRDPQQLSESLNISVSEVLTLRANVAESCLLNTMGADVPRRESKGSPPIDQEDVIHDRSDQNDSAGMSPKRHTKKRRRAATDQADSSSSPVTCPRVTPLFPGAITALDLSLARCTASGIQRTSTSSSLSDRLQPHQHTIFPPSAGSSCIRNTVWLTNGQS